jgi:hypothetical protein
MGYEIKEYPCTGPNGEDLMPDLITAVKDSIDNGRPALVWHAMTNAEWDVVSGYDDEKKVFFGRGSYTGLEGQAPHVESWNRAAKAVTICPAFGAVIIGDRTGEFDALEAEKEALRDAVEFGMREGVAVFKKWAEDYSKPGKVRDEADSYCFQVYHSTHGAAAGFLREIASHLDESAEKLLMEAADLMEKEAKAFAACWPYLWWSTVRGVDEERSAKVAPLLREAADLYEKAIMKVQDAVTIIDRA